MISIALVITFRFGSTLSILSIFKKMRIAAIFELGKKTMVVSCNGKYQEDK